MTQEDEKFLLKWALVVGFILGGVPAYPFMLNPPTPVLITVVPFVVSVGMHLLVKYMIKNEVVGLSKAKRVFAGIMASVFSIYVSLTLFGIIVGKDFWEWAFVFFFWATITTIPIGALVGIIYGLYLEKVDQGRIILKHDKMLLLFTSTISLGLFIIVPLISWWYSK